MTIQSILFSTHQELASICPLKRSQTYELLAAAFGFKSYAALLSQSIVFSDSELFTEVVLQETALAERIDSLGYTSYKAEVASVVTRNIKQSHLQAIDLGFIANILKGKDLDDQGFNNSNLFRENLITQPFFEEMQEKLEAMATSGNAKAHYALAMYYRKPADDEYDPSSQVNIGMANSKRERSSAERRRNGRIALRQR